MFVKKIPVGFIGTNCYILGCEQTKEAAIIDPGFSPERILAEVIKNGYIVRYVFLTHGHYDHILGVEHIKAKTGAKVVISKMDAYCLLSNSGSLAELAGQDAKTGPADIEVEDGDTISIGQLQCEFISTPGHTIGSMCIIVDDVIFSGDTLFYENCGRCDLPTGDYEQMLHSLKRLALMEGDYSVHPGHGESTVLSHERKTNPYMLEGLRCK